MKSFNRTRLISSLAGPAMAATAALAPLPGFLASGSVHAASSTDSIQIGDQAKFVNDTMINLPVTYKCSPNPAVPARHENILVQIIQPLTMGNGLGFAINPIVRCNGLTNHIIIPVVITHGQGFGAFNLGLASASATLNDSNGLPDVGTAKTLTVGS
jgi:hypothetical protein